MIASVLEGDRGDEGEGGEVEAVDRAGKAAGAEEERVLVQPDNTRVEALSPAVDLRFDLNRLLIHLHANEKG